MLHFTDDLSFTARVRVMRVLAVALLTGVLLFMGVIVWQPPVQVAQPVLGMLSMLAMLVLATQLPLAFAIPRLIAATAARQMAINPQLRGAESDENLRLAEALALLGRYQIAMIVGFSLLEACAFLGLIAYMQEGHLSGLIVAGVALAGMALQFPSRYKVTRWVENRQQQANEIRQRG